jgi:probable rRNA maturation factor
MITIEFFDVPIDDEIEKIALESVKSALEDEKIDLSIAFCDNPYIQALNAQYRGIDRPTDVLSFPSDEINPESGNRYLGDIVISLPQARTQAEAAPNPLTSEVAMLVVHGVLHLRGYDHDDLAEKKKMWDRQSAILLSLGIKIDKFTGDD